MGSPQDCLVCGKRLHSKQSLKRHMLLHTDQKPFQCELCQKCFRQKINLVTHMTAAHSDTKQYQCGVCGKWCKRNAHLKQHMLIHTGEKPFECTACGTNFRHKFGLNIHKQHHCTARIKLEDSTTDQSLPISGSKLMLSASDIPPAYNPSSKSHASKSEDTSATYSFNDIQKSCLVCTNSDICTHSNISTHSHETNTSIRVKKETDIQWEDQTIDKGNQLVLSSDCTVNNDLSDDYFKMDHKRLPDDGSTCANSSVNTEDITDYPMVNGGSSLKFMCKRIVKVENDIDKEAEYPNNEKMTEVSDQMTEAKDHMTKVKHPMTKTSDEMTMVEERKTEIHDHMTEANDLITTSSDKIKNYTCEFCFKVCYMKSHLDEHRRVHTGEKPFSCHFCENSFTTKHGLKNHLLRHTGERPYTCIVCNKTFRQSSSLNIHQRIHTGEHRVFTCPNCGVVVTNKGYLIAHMRKHCKGRNKN